ncbi:MAG: MucB/RseB C-terminal domain-containing protein [Methylomonas sp.]
MLIRILIALLLTISIAYADNGVASAQQWLEKMQAAMKNLNYQGTVVFIKNGQLDSMKYQHSLVNGLEQERLISLNSPLREITRRSNEVSCFFKETHEKIINHHPIDSSLLINFPQSVDVVNQNYLLGLDGEESVAMQTAQIVNIKPKDQLRYARKIWIAQQNFLPLKVETYHSDGSVLEQVVFTNLQIENNSLNIDNLNNGQAVHVKHLHITEAKPYEKAPFILKNWPNGFETVFFIPNSLQKNQKPVDHLLISDGFASVSVYLEPKSGQGVNGLQALGLVNSVSRVIGDFQVTVLGEVPANTVELIAAGITLH